MASIWTGSIAFGLVNIPVRVETAVRSHDLSFRLLHQPEGKGSLCPVKYERVCKDNGREIPWKQVVKGYEYEKGRFVVLEDEDFDRAASATSKTFDVQDFAPEGEVDPRFFEKPYYLIPQRGGERAYALLRDAMRSTGTLGVGTITLRKKQYLAALKPLGDAIVLDLMRFADEVLDASAFRFPEADYKKQELKMAEQLIGNLSEPFDPAKYRDEYRANLEKIIAAKLKGKKASLKEAAEPDLSGVIDLQERLRESLAAAGKDGKGGKSGGKAPARKRASSSSRGKRSA